MYYLYKTPPNIWKVTKNVELVNGEFHPIEQSSLECVKTIFKMIGIEEDKIHVIYNCSGGSEFHILEHPVTSFIREKPKEDGITIYSQYSPQTPGWEKIGEYNCQRPLRLYRSNIKLIAKEKRKEEQAERRRIQTKNKKPLSITELRNLTKHMTSKISLELQKRFDHNCRLSLPQPRGLTLKEVKSGLKSIIDLSNTYLGKRKTKSIVFDLYKSKEERKRIELTKII